MPYSKLAAAPWIAGNIAFLKDLDYLESRLKASGGKSTDRNDEGAKDDDRKKGGGKKKKGKSQASAKDNKDGAGDSATQ